jgi:hypothetical protein
MKKDLACRLNFNHKTLEVHCRSELAPFYAKFGWKIIDSPTTVDQPSGKVVFPRLTMILECGKKPWPKGTIDLFGLP